MSNREFLSYSWILLRFKSQHRDFEVFYGSQRNRLDDIWPGLQNYVVEGATLVLTLHEKVDSRVKALKKSMAGREKGGGF